MSKNIIKPNLNRKYIFKELEKLVKENKNSKILDLGCGDYYLGKYKNVEGYEISERKNVYFKPKIYDGKKLPETDNKYDIVISNNVIEHVENQEGYLKEIKRVLKNKGILVIFMPNSAYYFNRFFTINYYITLLKQKKNPIHGLVNKYKSTSEEKKNWTFKYYKKMFLKKKFNIIYYQQIGNILSMEKRFNLFNKYLKNSSLKNGTIHYFILQNNK